MPTYCDFAPGHPLHGPYHEFEYGFPCADESVLFERLVLEIMQAGLSWLIVLRKREAMARAFASYDVDRVAAFGEADVARLLADPGIIRNRKKVAAIIENARRVARLRESHGGFANWLASHHPRTRAQWVRLFKATFLFTGDEVVREFLLSLGYLPGAHRADCPVFARVAACAPPWMAVDAAIFVE